MSLKTNGEYVQEKYRTTGNGKPTFKGLMHKLIWPENQCKNTRLKGTQTIGEGDPLTNLEVSVGEAGTSWVTPWGLRYWQAPFWRSLTVSTSGRALSIAQLTTALWPGLTASQVINLPSSARQLLWLGPTVFLGASLAHQHAIVAATASPRQEGACRPHKGHPLNSHPWWPAGLCFSAI